MADGYAILNIDDVDSVAEANGMTFGEARFVRDQVGAEQVGLAHYRFKPGKRLGFGHHHDTVEEFYVVLEGTGRVKIDDDIRDLRTLDVVRVAPTAMREFEAGDDGMVLLAMGDHAKGQSHMDPSFWPEGDPAS